MVTSARFRYLDYDELAVLLKARGRGDTNIDTFEDIEIPYRHQGNFTIAILKRYNRIKVGIAKHNPIDPQNDGAARELALYRAIGNPAGGWQ